MVKLYAIYTNEHADLFNNWFMPTLKDKNIQLVAKNTPTSGGKYGSPGFRQAVLEKHEFILGAIRDNMGQLFIYSDVDIQFFRSLLPDVEVLLGKNHFICQKNAPNGQLCTGFIVGRGSEAFLNFFCLLKGDIEKEGRDQLAFNRRALELKNKDELSFDTLPDRYFGGGTLTGKLWNPGEPLEVPSDIVLHHANWTIGNDNKVAQLKYVRDVVAKRASST